LNALARNLNLEDLSLLYKDGEAWELAGDEQVENDWYPDSMLSPLLVLAGQLVGLKLAAIKGGAANELLETELVVLDRGPLPPTLIPP
jgi:hypothetical protein